MRVHYRVLYLPHNSGVTEVPQNYWDTRKFALAVKHGTINGYCHIPGLLFGQTLVNAKNVGIIRQRFGAWLLKVARRELESQSFVLVPTPSTDAVQGAAGPFRSTEALAEAVRGRSAVADILRFGQKVEKASNGGPRFAREIYPLLSVTGRAPRERIVLFDDLLTSGGHLKAAKRRLEENGGGVSCAIVCGRTVHDTSGDPWCEGFDDINDDF